MQKILGLDLATRKTGYALLSEKGHIYKKFYGVIDSSEGELEERFNVFLDGLKVVLGKTSPNLVVIEATPAHNNVKTSRIMAMFEALARNYLYNNKYDYLVVHVSTLRSSLGFGKASKEEIFKKIVDKYKLNDFKFSDHNDITDAIVCALYGVEAIKGRLKNV